MLQLLMDNHQKLLLLLILTKILMQLVCWKSEKKIGTLTYIDDRGEQQKTTVDEDFEIPVGMEGEMQVEWFWIPRTWEGVQIGPSIFLAFESPYQFNTVDNPYKSKLPFIGRVYSNLNSKPTSLVDLIKPYQYLYNIIWYRLELEFAKAKGKKFVMDMAQLPKSKGWSVEQWMYYFDTLGIAFINSKEEGRDGDENSTAKFNQFTGIDMSLSTAIQGYFTMLSKIEECVENITGITRQRKGQINTSETVGGVERSVKQSNALTEIYFHEHSMVKEKVLEHLLELSKICYSNNEQGKLVFDEFTREMLDTKGLLYTDFGLYVTDSVRENGILEQLKGIAKEGISSGTLEFSNLITLVKSNSVAEVENSVKQSEKSKREQADAQNQTAQAQIESQEKISKETLDREDRNKQLDRENKIQIAEIGTLRGKDGPSDLNTNGIPDAMELGKLALDQSREEFNQKKETNKLSLEMEKLQTQNQQFLIEQQQQNQKNKQDAVFKAKELELKEKDIEVKKKALKYKAKPSTKK